MSRRSSTRAGESQRPVDTLPNQAPRFGALAVRCAALALGALVTISCAQKPEKPISADPKLYNAGTLLQDCVDCPKMVVVEPGSFEMGSLRGETDEKPRRQVTLPHAFAVGVYEVTFQEWASCVEEGGCSHKPADEGWGRQQRPLVNVSWNDAQDYIAWLNRKTGMDYRLLTEAEWEYAARADSAAIDISGQGIGNCRYCYSREHTQLRYDRSGRTVPRQRFQASRYAWQRLGMGRRLLCPELPKRPDQWRGTTVAGLRNTQYPGRFLEEFLRPDACREPRKGRAGRPQERYRLPHCPDRSAEQPPGNRESRIRSF